mgnify:CR=1 FL=1
MNGKMKCEILKRIRCSIAELNEIKYEPKPCDHKEDCLGTCPRCAKEAEVVGTQVVKNHRHTLLCLLPCVA